MCYALHAASGVRAGAVPLPTATSIIERLDRGRLLLVGRGADITSLGGNGDDQLGAERRHLDFNVNTSRRAAKQKMVDEGSSQSAAPRPGLVRPNIDGVGALRKRRARSESHLPEARDRGP